MPVTAAAQSGVVSLFYRDSALLAGVVAQFNTATEAWSVFSPEDFAEGDGPAHYSLIAGGGQIYAAWESDSLGHYQVYR